MGNCQAVDAATVAIQHPGGGRAELAYWALPAGEVMAANPGHYVAAVITVPQTLAADGAATKGGAPVAAPVKHLKLLRPDDTLQLGRVYRLVSFEEVLKEFATKRHVKLSRVMVKAKDDEGEVAKKPAKPRRRRGSNTNGGAPEESDRSLAKVMRQSKEEEEAAAAAAPKTGGEEEQRDDAASGTGVDKDDDCDLESLLPHGLALGRRMGRQWKPALQSIAEGRD